MKHTFRTLIFDFDGTLVDTLPDIFAALNTALRQMARPELSLEETAKLVGPGREAFIHSVIPDGDEDSVTRFLDMFRDAYWANCLETTRVFPGMASVLEHFSDRILAVATNKPLNFIEKIMRGVGIHEYFHTIIGPEHVKKVKPDPEMLLKVLEETSSAPEASLFIGDTVEDMQASRRAGITFCRAAYGYGNHFDLADSKPDYLLKRPADLIAIGAN